MPSVTAAAAVRRGRAAAAGAAATTGAGAGATTAAAAAVAGKGSQAGSAATPLPMSQPLSSSTSKHGHLASSAARHASVSGLRSRVSSTRAGREGRVVATSESVRPQPARESVVRAGTCAKNERPLCAPRPPLPPVLALPSGFPSKTAWVRAGHRDRSMLSLPGGGAKDSVEDDEGVGALLGAAAGGAVLLAAAPRAEAPPLLLLLLLSVATHLKLLSAMRRMVRYRQGGACRQERSAHAQEGRR